MAEYQPSALTEYQSCQYHIQTIDMRLWQSAAIMIGASFAALAVLSREQASTPLCVGVSLASLAALAIFGLWTRLWQRRDAAVELLETRMREIEWKTDMRKTIFLTILRHQGDRFEMEEWKRLAPEEQATLQTSYRALPKPNASYVLYVTAMIALAGWPALAIGKLVELVISE